MYKGAIIIKYKVLIGGANRIIVDNLFSQASSTFECMTTSENWDDILCHIKYFKPDAFVYLIESTFRDELIKLRTLKNNNEYLPLFLIGEEDVCDEIKRLAPDIAELFFKRPVSSMTIKDNIVDFLDKQKEAAKIMEDMKKAAQEQLQLNQKDRCNVLVIDDDRGVLKMLKEVLNTDYEVTTVTSGKWAMKYLETKKPALILLDYEMPEESGAEVFKKILEHDELKEIPVVFLTGVADKNRIREVLALSPAGYLLKPINVNRLKDTIEDVIDK